MTPNKLPPLPETNEYIEVSLEPAYTAEDMHAYAAEALRQSQSLPAGAVAGLVGKWRAVAEKQRGMAKRDNERGDPECAARMAGMAERSEYVADELEQALQADAREKGESVVGRCCYGGYRTKAACASCAAWTATQPAQASEKDECASVPRDALLTEARRLRYRATETYGLGPAMTDAGAQMIHTAEALEGFASSGQEKE